MSRITRNKNWEEFRHVFGRVLECDDKGMALQVLNGIRVGYSRSKEVSVIKIHRINTIEELIKLYK